jgi:TRAP-type C4-dicarboxylate transport system substrate-binding protein
MKPLKTLVLTVAMAAAAGAAFAQDVSWQLGSAVGPEDPSTRNYQELARRIAERTDGAFEIEVVPIETLGFKNVDSLRVLKQGVMEAMAIVPYYVTRDEPLMGVFVPHGMLVDPEENLKVVDVQYDIAREILGSDKWGIELVARSPFGIGRDLIMLTTEPINTLDGLREIKFRHFSKDGLQAFNALGVSTQVVPSSELYLALKTGVVDGAAYGPTYAVSQSLYEVTCCFTYLGASSMAYPFSIGVTEAAWAALPEDYRTALVEEADRMWREAVDEWRAAEQEEAAYATLIEKGMQRLEPMPIEDRRAIQAELIGIWKSGCDDMGETAESYCQRIEQALSE